MESGSDLSSRAVSSQVLSALKGLTSVFGMGTGGTPSSLPPEMVSVSGLRCFLTLAFAALRFASLDTFRFTFGFPPLARSVVRFAGFRTLTTAHSVIHISDRSICLSSA